MRLRSATIRLAVRLAARLAAALAAVLAGACTVGTTDVIPTAPEPRPIRLTITPLGGGMLSVGGAAPFTIGGTTPAGVLGAFAEYNNGNDRYVAASWTSDNDTVVAIVEGGIVARGRGQATLTARFEGLSDTETFTVEGGVPGRWSGRYVVEQCVASTGVMIDALCAQSTGRAGLSPVGASIPAQMEITENGTTLTGVIQIGAIRGTLTGINRGVGFFSMQGEIRQAPHAIRILHWDTHVARDAMEGFIAYEIVIDGVNGVGSVAGKLVEMTRQ